MSSPPPARALYLQGRREPVFGMLHTPASRSERDTAVLICPPFGWEDVCSYRSRRDWAEQLARAGYPTLRIDLPGTGDSAGSVEDGDQLAAWLDAVASSAGWLLASAAGSRVCAIGIGLGGLLACAATAGGAPIDELVLWAVPSRGRTFVRELRVFGSMEVSQYADRRGLAPAAEPEPAPAEGVAAGGFLLGGETARGLEGLDLTELALPDGRPRRVLLLERDGIGVDERLREHLLRGGAQVRVEPGPGYGVMMAEPQLARPPTDVIARVEAWLGETAPTDTAAALAGGQRDRPDGASRVRPATPVAVVKARDSAELIVDGVRIRETALSIDQPFGRMFGVLAEPAEGATQDLGAVLLNAGAIRRIGPNRMWVEIARRWASRGVPSLRLDLEGLGDADGDATRFADVAELYVPEMVVQVRGALDALSSRGTARRFVLAGLCSGAYWSFHGALQDERVVAAFMLNPRTLFWNASAETARELRRVLLHRTSWMRLLHGEGSPARLGALARTIPGGILALARRRISRWKTRRFGGDELDLALDRLRDVDKRLLFVFSGQEPFHEELQREGRLSKLDRWPNVELSLLAGRDHTLRPPESQRDADAALDRALDRELQRAASRARLPAAASQ